MNDIMCLSKDSLLKENLIFVCQNLAVYIVTCLKYEFLYPTLQLYIYADH